MTPKKECNPVRGQPVAVGLFGCRVVFFAVWYLLKCRIDALGAFLDAHVHTVARSGFQVIASGSLSAAASEPGCHF